MKKKIQIKKVIKKKVPAKKVASKEKYKITIPEGFLRKEINEIATAIFGGILTELQIGIKDLVRANVHKKDMGLYEKLEGRYENLYSQYVYTLSEIINVKNMINNVINMLLPKVPYEDDKESKTVAVKNQDGEEIEMGLGG